MSNFTEFQVTQDVVFQIEDKPHTVSIAVSIHPKTKYYYWLDAVTETGFNLCGSSHGFFKGSVAMNTKLRSEASIATEMLGVLDNFIQSIRQIETQLILTGKYITAEISGTECYAWLPDAPFFPASNIESNASGTSLSWYEHDVFQQRDIELYVYRNADGHLRFRANENELYDQEKLEKLYNSDAFKKSKLAFFKYNELRRLLGKPIQGDPKRMSGLF